MVSTIVHAVMPDGDVGFTEGGELTVSEVDGLAAKPIAHTNATVSVRVRDRANPASAPNPNLLHRTMCAGG